MKAWARNIYTYSMQKFFERFPLFRGPGVDEEGDPGHDPDAAAPSRPHGVRAQAKRNTHVCVPSISEILPNT
jgi:hypothetical protein